MSAAEILREIQSLPLRDRLELVGAVWDSILDDDADGIPVTAAQRTLLEERLRRAREDPAAARPLADVLDEIEARL